MTDRLHIYICEDQWANSSGNKGLAMFSHERAHAEVPAETPPLAPMSLALLAGLNLCCTGWCPRCRTSLAACSDREPIELAARSVAAVQEDIRRHHGEAAEILFGWVCVQAYQEHGDGTFTVRACRDALLRSDAALAAGKFEADIRAAFARFGVSD